MLEIAERVGDLRLSHAGALVSRTMLRLMPDEADKKGVIQPIAQGDVIVFAQLALDRWLRGLPNGVVQPG
jgi:hypothetical protein